MFNFRKILAITFDRISGEATAAYYNIIGAQLDSDSAPMTKPRMGPICLKLTLSQ